VPIDQANAAISARGGVAAVHRAYLSCALALFASVGAGNFCVAAADPPAAPPTAEAPAPAQTAAVKAAPPTLTDAHIQQLEKQLRSRGYAARMMRGAVFFCRREVPLGSHLASEYNCVSVEGAERIANSSREDLESMQRQSGHCLITGNRNANCGS
jgi:hypothetical protein